MTQKRHPRPEDVPADDDNVTDTFLSSLYKDPPSADYCTAMAIALLVAARKLLSSEVLLSNTIRGDKYMAVAYSLCACERMTERLRSEDRAANQ